MNDRSSSRAKSRDQRRRRERIWLVRRPRHSRSGAADGASTSLGTRVHTHAGEIRMKLVVAVIRPEKLNDVLEALFHAEVKGLTISRVQGHGGETERVETYRGMTVKMELSEKVRIEIGVSDHFVEPTVNAIMNAARTGDVGDGKIFVLPVEQVYRIRTGETDRAAVTPVGVPPG